MNEIVPSAQRALTLVTAFLSEPSADLIALCRFADEVCAHYEETYPEDDDTDLSSEMMWLFSAEMRNMCRHFGQGDYGLDTIRDVLNAYVPHLERGQEAWREMVARGEWPFNWDDQS